MTNKNDIELPLLSRKDSGLKKNSYSNSSVKIRVDDSKKPNHVSHFIQYLDSSSTDDRYSARPSFFKWLVFADIFPFIKRMNQASDKFGFEDIPKPEKSFNVEDKVIQLDYYWANELQKGSPKFSIALFKAFRPEIIKATGLMFVDHTTKIYYSIYMGKIINIMTSNELTGTNRADELIYAGILLSMLVAISLLAKNWALFTIHMSIGRAKLAISGLLYKKVNSTSLTSLHEIKMGKVINLIGNDLNDMQGLHMAPTVVVNPFYYGFKHIYNVGLLWSSQQHCWINHSSHSLLHSDLSL